MKTLKFIFFAVLFSTTLASCTDLETDEDPQQTIIENSQATGDKGETSNSGTKD